jgi:hypothetical protein
MRLREVENAYLVGFTVQNFMEGFLGTVELDLGAQGAKVPIRLIRSSFIVVEGGITYKIVEARQLVALSLTERQS